METTVKTIEELQEEIEDLQYRLSEANETIEAIRTGQIDALVVESTGGHQLYTLKSADIAYRVFIEQMTEGAITLNKEGIILYCNSQFATMVNLPLSTVIGLPFQNFIRFENRDNYQELFTKCWTEGCKGEVELKTGNHTIPVKLSLTALQLEEGVSLSIILTDLTAQKATQAQLEQKNDQLGQMNHALEVSNHDLQQFASVASHDLQEPLRKIQLFSNLLKERGDGDLTPQTKSYVEKIIDSAGRMKALIIDVLDYSKLSATDNPFELVNLNELVRELLDDLDFEIQEKKAIVQTGELPAIEVNRGQLRQVFQNLLSNALKFSHPLKPPVISIEARRVAEKSFRAGEEEKGGYCIISVTDNGIGFDEKYIDRIFSIFERLHSKEAYEGTGIGLAITKKIIDKHRGLVAARSTEGRGASFQFLLPVKQERAARNENKF